MITNQSWMVIECLCGVAPNPAGGGVIEDFSRGRSCTLYGSFMCFYALYIGRFRQLTGIPTGGLRPLLINSRFQKKKNTINTNRSNNNILFRNRIYEICQKEDENGSWEEALRINALPLPLLLKCSSGWC